MFGWFKSKPVSPPQKPGGLFSTHGDLAPSRRARPFINWPEPTRITPTVGMDAATDIDDTGTSAIKTYGQAYYGVPDAQYNWYSSQGFIGYQVCAMLAQHWLIEKVCSMPARDAVRKGYDLSIDSGDKVDPKIIDYIKKMDKRFCINAKLIDFIRGGRIFGIRVALFVVNSTDPDYYKNPFNIDGVLPGSYKGIRMIDPYWIVPELTSTGVNNPASLSFYVPDYWRMNGMLVHKSHLVIYTTGDVPDVLKPMYMYGGVSIPQKVFERVYGAERCANEAPMLTMTKRLTVLKTDLSAITANQSAFEERMDWWQATRDNYGVKVNGEDDEVQQFDLTLTDLDAVIMTQYQIVAMIGEVPGTKLLGTQPKGFNSTGEFEQSSYHEMLETLQYNDCSRILDRHHALIWQAFVMPKFGLPSMEVNHAWAKLDAMTEQELCTVNATKAETDAALVASGAIDAQDVRNRIIADRESGYSGLSAQVPPPDPTVDPAAAAAAPKPPMIKPKPIPGA